MQDLSSFTSFMQNAHEREPFPWQIRLVEMLMEGTWPEVIDVPTGLGKTSVIDAWVYVLALFALDGRRSDFPRRLCFIVDRRIIVDDADSHARALAAKLESASAGNALSDIKQGLLSLTGGKGDILSVVRMRGGLTWESRWLRRPDQPALVTGTVDQLGSRLLFRGYGASERMRPIDAAFVGLDAWVVVDEAHIAGPLVGTVERVRRLQETHETAFSGRALRLTIMSATAGRGRVGLHGDLTTEGPAADDIPVARSSERVRLHADRTTEGANEEARRRLSTSKPAALIELGGLKPKKRAPADFQDLGRAMAAVAERQGQDAKAIAVIANTIATARACLEQLESKGHQVCLVIGRCRPYERGFIEREWLRKVQVGSKRDYEGSLFVVATQTIEVGANLDFDLVVSEAAPFASLVQRFGRVNRLGVHREHQSAIVYAPAAHDEDPIYGESTGATWEWLTQIGKGSQPVGKAADLAKLVFESHIDLGPEALRTLLSDPPLGVTPVAPHTPVLLGAHVEAWARTQPPPDPDQSVAPFLRGVDQGLPEVSVAWRAGPPKHDQTRKLEEVWQEWLDLAPPAAWEFVEVPIWEVRALLAGMPPSAPTTDIEGIVGKHDPMVEVDGAPGVVLLKRDEVALLGEVGVQPGDRVILRSEVGGHDKWGWVGAGGGGKPVPDVGDLIPARTRPVMRLAEEILATWIPSSTVETWERLQSLDPAEPDEFELILGVLDQAGVPYPRGEFERVIRTTFGTEDHPVRLVHLQPADPESTVLPIDFVSDDDETSTSVVGGGRVTLSQHGASVGSTAREFAENLGLEEALVRIVELAGEYHDIGKSDPRFQVALHLGDELAALASLEPLAKSGRDPRDPVARRGWHRSGLKKGFRHEAISERLVLGLLEHRQALFGEFDRDLLLHLIAAHHGHGRPLMPPIPQPDDGSFEYSVDGLQVAHLPRASQVDWSHVQRFEKLNARYGWWGLAALEAIVRLADMLCSEEGR
jgi:CRISPR-associated endonuclease/helicase Cas3